MQLIHPSYQNPNLIYHKVKPTKSGHRCPSTPCMQETYNTYMKGGLFLRESFWACGQTYCPLGDGLSFSLAPQEINGTASALGSWEGEGAFAGQKRRTLAMCAAGRTGQSLNWHISPSVFLFISLCSLPSSYKTCCIAPAQWLWRALQGKAGGEILNFAPALFSNLCRAFSTLIAYGLSRLTSHPWHL